MGFHLRSTNVNRKTLVMSFSFDFTAADKTAAYDRATAELDSIEQSQPAHKKDAWLVRQTVRAYLDLLANDDDRPIRVSVHGSVGYEYNPADPSAASPDTKYTQASMGVAVYYVSKVD
jgi:hypothetical protein